MVLNCLLVDDEPLAINILKEYCKDIKQLRIVGEFSGAIEAGKMLKEQAIDLIYLDINLPKLSGIDFLKILTDPPLIIFTTAYPEFAVEAFELEAFDYLVKPISKERFIKSFDKAQRFLAERTTDSAQYWIKIKEGKRLYKVDSDSIQIIQAYGDYVKIHTKEKIFVSKMRIGDLSFELPDTFIQVHRSYILNINHIKFLEGNMVSIGSQKIPVSQPYKEDLHNRL